MELTTCSACGAANHPARTTCGRCLVPMNADADAPSAGAVSDEATALLDEVDPTVEVAALAGGTGPVAEAGAADQAAGRRRDPARAGDTQPLEPVDPQRPPPGAAPSGADTSSGPPSSPSSSPAPAGATGAYRRRSSSAREQSRRGPLIVGIGAAIGAGIGLAASLGLGPFASEAAPPTFDENVYRRDTVSVAIASVSATSELPPTGSTSYEPALMADGDVTTAWNSLGDSRPDGVGEQITVELADPAWVTAIRVANGDQRDDARFLANASLSRVVATFDDGTQLVLVFLDQPGEQQVALPRPVLTSRVVLAVQEAHPGDASQDLAVSEIAVIGHVALGADRAWLEAGAAA